MDAHHKFAAGNDYSYIPREEEDDVASPNHRAFTLSPFFEGTCNIQGVRVMKRQSCSFHHFVRSLLM